MTARLRVAAISVALVAVTFVAFSGLRANAFLNYDDDLYVTGNAHVRQGLTEESVAWAFTTFDAAMDKHFHRRNPTGRPSRGGPQAADGLPAA